nr:MAG TPA: hypothetical protein [Caudoviricetes sp.]
MAQLVIALQILIIINYQKILNCVIIVLIQV